MNKNIKKILVTFAVIVSATVLTAFIVRATTITTINGTDTLTSSRTVINTNFSNLNSGKAELSGDTFTGKVTFTVASSSSNFEFLGYASPSQLFGAGLKELGGTSGCSGATDTLNYNSTTGKFSCGSDAGSGAIDTTTVEATTWGAGANASNLWTFNLTGTDPTLLIGSSLFSFTGAASVSSNFEVSGGYASASSYYAPGGTNSLPSYTFGNDTNTGFYRVGADAVGLSAGGTTLQWNTGALIPGTDAARGLGSTSNRWNGVFTTNASVSTTFESLGTASISGALTQNTLASNSFTGSLTVARPVRVTANGTVGAAGVTVGDAKMGIYLVSAATLGLTNGVSGLSWNGTQFYPNTDVARSLGIAGTNRWNGLFTTNASVSTAFESATASISGAFTASSNVASHSFGGSIEGTADNQLSLGTDVRALKRVFSYIGKFITSLFIPNTAGGLSAATTGGIAIDTTSKSFNFADGTTEYVVPSKVCRGGGWITPTVGDDYPILYFGSPFTITDVVAIASSSNDAVTSVGFNLTYGRNISTGLTNVFTANHNASSSQTAQHFSGSVTGSQITSDAVVSLRVASVSTETKSVLVTVCGRYTN